VKQSAVLVEMIDAGSLAALRRTLVAILGYTLAIETVGALLLYAFAGYHPEVALGPDDADPIAGAGSRLWWAVFHSVSAFCNAGFSLSHGSLTGLVSSWPVCLTVMALILLGGIGFPVMEELRRNVWSRLRGQRPDRLSLHSRVVLATSGGLVAVVAVIVLALEWNHTLADLPWHTRILAASFLSVTMRTAGFNTIDTGSLHAATLALTCVMMFIGASPGSTGGGIKTTTFAAIFAEFRAEIRGQGPARLFDRQLVPGVVRRAIGVAFLGIGMVAVVTFVLLVTEEQAPLRVFFEVVSAFGTVGLSTGITGALSPAGKLAITALMFAGRIGPITLALALAAESRRVPVERASERVMIG
jgi:trk system potassium uptake protein TrkH